MSTENRQLILEMLVIDSHLTEKEKSFTRNSGKLKVNCEFCIYNFLSLSLAFNKFKQNLKKINIGCLSVCTLSVAFINVY